MKKLVKDRQGSALIVVILLLLMITAYCGLMASLIQSSSKSNLQLQGSQQAYLTAKSGLQYVTNYLADKKSDDIYYGQEFIAAFGNIPTDKTFEGKISLDPGVTGEINKLTGDKFLINIDKTNMPKGYYKVVSTAKFGTSFYDQHEIRVFKIIDGNIASKEFVPPECRLTTGGMKNVNLMGGSTGDVLLKGESVYEFKANSGGTEFQNVVSKGGFNLGGGAAELNGGFYALSWIFTKNTLNINGSIDAANGTDKAGLYSCKGIWSTSVFKLNGNVVVDARMYTDPEYYPVDGEGKRKSPVLGRETYIKPTLDDGSVNPATQTSYPTESEQEALKNSGDDDEWQGYFNANPDKISLGDIVIGEVMCVNTDPNNKKVVASSGNVTTKITGGGYMAIYALGDVTLNTSNYQHADIYAMGNVYIGSQTQLKEVIIKSAKDVILTSRTPWGYDSSTDVINSKIYAKGNIEVDQWKEYTGTQFYCDGEVLKCFLSWEGGSPADKKEPKPEKKNGPSGIDVTALKTDIENHLRVIATPLEGSSVEDMYSAQNSMKLDEYIKKVDDSCLIGTTTVPSALLAAETIKFTDTSFEHFEGPYMRNNTNYNSSNNMRILKIDKSCKLETAWTNAAGPENSGVYVLYINAGEGPIDILIDNKKVEFTNACDLCINDNGGANRVRFFLYGPNAELTFGSQFGPGHVYRVKNDKLEIANETTDDKGKPILSSVPMSGGLNDFNYGGADGGIPELYVFGAKKPGVTVPPNKAAGGKITLGQPGNVFTFRGYILSKVTDVDTGYEGRPVFCGMVFCRNLRCGTANTSECIEDHVPTNEKYGNAVNDIWDLD